jgi:hypothetical protein
MQVRVMKGIKGDSKGRMDWRPRMYYSRHKNGRVLLQVKMELVRPVRQRQVVVMLIGGYQLMTLVVTRSLTRNLPLKEAFINMRKTRMAAVRQE